MSEEIKRVEQEICPTPGCGARLPIAPIGSVTLLHASFPQEPLLVSSLLKGGMTHVYCSQCGQSSPYHSSALCFVGPIHTAFVYVPTEAAKLYPEVMIELHNKLEEAISTLDGGRIEIITNAAEYKKQLAAAISNLVIPLLNDYFLTGEPGKPEPDEWLFQNKERLDRTFFAGALLLIQKAIPCHVFIASEENDINEDMAVNTIRNDIRDILLWRALQLARQLVADKHLSSVEEVVAKAIHPDIIDIAMVKFLAGAVAYFEEKSDTPGLYNYAYHAVLAAICDLAKQENPRQEHWAGWFTAFELTRRTSKNQSAFRGITVPLTFAKRTITPEQFWDQLGPRFNQAMQQYDKEALELFHNVAKDLELEDLQHWLATGITPIFDEIPVDMLEEMLEAVTIPLALQDPDASLLMIKSCLRGLANRDPVLLMRFGRKVRSSMWANEQREQSIWITCYMSEILNDFNLHRLAKQVVDDGIEELEKAHSWPPESKGAYIALLTEKGNCMRHIGEPLASLECYELCKHILPDDLSNQDVRTNERNRAIVLREVGKVHESLSILSKLLPHTRSSEKAMVLSSISACQSVLGHRQRAEDMLRQALTILPKGGMVNSLRLSLLMSLAFLAKKEHDFDLALASAVELLDIAKNRHNLWMQITAIGLASTVARHLLKGEELRFDMIGTAIQMLEAVTRMPEAFRPPLRHEIALRVLLSELLEEKGEIVKAEGMLQQALARHPRSGSDQPWVIWAKLAQYAQMQGNNELARTHLLQARQAVMDIVTQVEVESDPFALMVDKDHLQNVMADEFLKAYHENKINASDLRLVADFQASVVLSHHLSLHWKPEEYEAILAKPLLDPEDQLKQFVAQETSLNEKIGILQAFEASSNLYLFLTEVSPSSITSQLLPLRLERHALNQLTHRTSFRLAQCRVAQKNDPLEKISGWREFVSALRSAVSSCINPGTHLCIVPGPLSGLPLQLALGQDYPLNYAPSLAVAHLLHHRRLQMKGGPRWRPSSVHDFVVWRVGERPEMIEHFQSASVALEADLSTLGIQYAHTSGVAGTREALFRTLQMSECVRLSCHGRVRTDNLRFELLVAADNQLPPSDASALDSERGQQFLVNWQAITELPQCAPIVFSTACASGMAISLRGGERIGLERPLFGAGTVTYIAPLWPVPVAQIQPLINRIMISYVGNSQRAVADVVFEEVNAAIAEGVPSWVARSVAVLGDWL